MYICTAGNFRFVRGCAGVHPLRGTTLSQSARLRTDFGWSGGPYVSPEWPRVANHAATMAGVGSEAASAGSESTKATHRKVQRIFFS